MSDEPESISPIRLVEAALFTAGRALALDELVESTALDIKSIKRAVKALEMAYEDAGDGTALEVRQAGDKWAMQLRARYVEHAKRLAAMEIPKKLLKTLALIAFHQPLKQSELVDMIGTKTYDHVHELIEFGLVKARVDGVTKRLTTSPSFPEYFGIPATDTQQLRTYLAEKVGLTLKTPSGESPLAGFDNDAQVPSGADAVSGVEEAAAAEDAADGEAEMDDEPEAAAVTVGFEHEATA